MLKVLPARTAERISIGEKARPISSSVSINWALRPKPATISLTTTSQMTTGPCDMAARRLSSTFSSASGVCA